MVRSRPILLVDDRGVEPILSAIFQCGLPNQVIVVPDGMEALDLLHRRGKYASHVSDDPAVLILNISCLRADGLRLVQRVRADPEFGQTPIVVFTATLEGDGLTRSYEAGVNSVVIRPAVVLDEFVETVRCIAQFWAVSNVAPPQATVARALEEASDSPTKTASRCNTEFAAIQPAESA